MLEPEQQLKLMVQHRPWEGEPDNAEWEDGFTGYQCRIRRHPELLHLNGYVGIPKWHRLFGCSYDDDAVDIKIHGGLTFSAIGDDGLWWFGFDCGHAGDLVPGVLLSIVHANVKLSSYNRAGTYRTWEYVENEVTHLALMLWRIQNEPNETRD